MPSRTSIEPAAAPAVARHRLDAVDFSMSRSSWTATGAGRARAACRRCSAISAAPRRSGGPSKVAGSSKIRYLTLFAFSSENWRRPASEVTELMNLLRFYLRREINELARNGVRLRFLGERDADGRPTSPT